MSEAAYVPLEPKKPFKASARSSAPEVRFETPTSIQFKGAVETEELITKATVMFVLPEAYRPLNHPVRIGVVISPEEVSIMEIKLNGECVLETTETHELSEVLLDNIIVSII